MKISEMDSRQKLIGGGLILLIIVIAVVMIIFRHTIFTQVIEIKFPDGCVEKYENGIAVTPICTNGRMLQEQSNSMVNIPFRSS